MNTPAPAKKRRFIDHNTLTAAMTIAHPRGIKPLGNMFFDMIDAGNVGIRDDGLGPLLCRFIPQKQTKKT